MSLPFESTPGSNNPVSPPQATNYAAQRGPATKPSMATVFGILNLIFGGLSLLAQAIGIIMVVGGLFALVLAEIYEVVGFFVIRSKGVTQQFQAWDEVVNGQRPNESFNFK